MPTQIDGTTGVSKVQDGAVVQADLAANVVGNGPAFQASMSSSVALTSNVLTKLAVNSEAFDTANAFDAVTNYRFQPAVAGYYQFNGFVVGISASTTLQLGVLTLNKNGTPLIGSSCTYIVSGITNQDANVSGMIYLNGTTDYVELWGRIVGSGTLTMPTATLQGFLARAA